VSQLSASFCDWGREKKAAEELKMVWMVDGGMPVLER
jgi:hypothetical protein